MSTSTECTHVSVSEFDMTGKHIGSGSYSEVSLAIRHQGRIPFAVKIIDKEKAQRRNTVKYVLNEREVMITLQHHYIIKLQHTSRDLHHVYFFYEYCRNGELWLLLQKHKGKVLRQDIALKWFCQILSAVKYLHLEKNIAHRDIKPENMFLDDLFNLKLGDFGTSKRLLLLPAEDAKREIALKESITKFDSNNSHISKEDAITAEFESHRRKSIMYTATRGNSFTGTPEYMAPESAHNKNTRGSAVDQWSQGVLAYQLHTGVLPFRAESPFLVFLEMDKMNIDYSTVTDPLWYDLIKQQLRPKPSQRLGVTAASIPDGQVDMNTDQIEAMSPDLCIVRKKPMPLPQSQACVNATEEGWNALQNHALFSNMDWDNLNLTEDQRDAVLQLHSLADPTVIKKDPISMDTIDAEFGEEVADAEQPTK